MLLAVLGCIPSCSQHLEQDRHEWEQQLQEDFELQRSALRDQQQQRLWLLRKQMEDQELLLTEQLTAGQESRVNALRMQVQVGLSEWI